VIIVLHTVWYVQDVNIVEQQYDSKSSRLHIVDPKGVMQCTTRVVKPLYVVHTEIYLHLLTRFEGRQACSSSIVNKTIRYV
jgi:hypothetical protein